MNNNGICVNVYYLGTFLYILQSLTIPVNQKHKMSRQADKPEEKENEKDDFYARLLTTSPFNEQFTEAQVCPNLIFLFIYLFFFFHTVFKSYSNNYCFN